MSESLEQRALRIRKEMDEEIDALGGLIFQCARYERPSMEWREAITVFMDEFARRLMAEQGEPVAYAVQTDYKAWVGLWMAKDVAEQVAAKRPGDKVIPLYAATSKEWCNICHSPGPEHIDMDAAPAAPPQDALETFLKECEAEAAHIEKNGSTLRTKFGDEHEGRCRELCAMYLRDFIISYRMGQRFAAIDAARKEHP